MSEESMKALLLGLIFLLNLTAMADNSLRVGEVKVYGIEEHREGEKRWPAVAFVLYPSGELEVIQKYSDEKSGVVQKGNYSINNGKIVLELTESTCKPEKSVPYSEEVPYVENDGKLGVYQEQDQAFLDKHFNYEMTGCLLD